MATAWETFPIKFQGGLISNLNVLDHGLTAPGSAIILKNFEPSVHGGYSKVLGYSKFSTFPVPSTGQIVSTIVATPSKVIAVRDNKYYTSSGGAWTLRATAAINGITLVRQDHFNFSGTEKIVMVDGINAPLFYNPITDVTTYNLAAPAEVLGADIVKVFKNHIFYAKNNILSFTVPYEETSFNTGDGAGSINIGCEITGLVVFRDQLIVFGIDRILRISGNTSSDFILEPIADRTGCLVHESIQEVGGDILYLGPDGVRYLSATQKIGDFGLERASSNIQKEINTLIKSAVKFVSTVIRGKSQYRLFSFSSSVPDTSSETYLATRYSDQSTARIEWSQLSGFKVYSVNSRQYLEDEYIVFCSDTNYVYRMESGSSFDGEPIECIFQTPFMPISDPRIRKTVYKHSLYSTTSGLFELTCAIKLDYLQPNTIQPASFVVGSSGGGGAVYGASGSIYGVSLYSSPVQDLFVNAVNGSGFTIALRYSEVSTRPSFTLDYALLEYRNNERR